MALQVWLPLNGNLENRGLSNSTATASGATVDANGKIGSCYKFVAGNYIGIDAKNVNNHKYSSISIAMWVYPTQSNGTEVYLVNCYESGGVGMCWQNQKAKWQIYANSGYRVVLSSSTLSLNTWHHLVGTYDGRRMKLYIDGILDGTFDLGGDYPITYHTTCPWEIGGNPGATSFGSGNFIGSLNDVRIYDHCLSAKEVKEISKGLILNYKLDDMYNTSINLVENGNLDKGTTNWVSTGSSNIITGDTPADHPEIKAAVYNNSSSSYIPYSVNDTLYYEVWIKAYNQGTQSYTYPSFRIYDIDKKEIQHYHCPDGFQTASQTTLTQDLKPGDTVLHVASASGFSTSKTKRVAIFGYRDSTGYEYPAMTYTQNCVTFSAIDTANNTITLSAAYSGVTVPAGKTVCQSINGNSYFYPFSSIAISSITSWTLKSTSVVVSTKNRMKYGRYLKIWSYPYALETGFKLTRAPGSTSISDCSGYGNDGVINGTPVLKAGSGRYNNATTFNTSSYITNSTVTTPNILTISAWVYLTEIPSTSRIIAVHPQSKLAAGFFSSNNMIVACNGTSSPEYLRTGTNLTANAWNHVCVTGPVGSSKCYINGILCPTNGTKTNNWTITNKTQLYIAGRINSTLGNMLDGSLSDLRLYVTELSADDVLELYNTGAYVDNAGNIETCQVDECVTTAPQVTKTAELQVGSLIECDENVKTLSDGSTWVRVLHHNNPASKLFTTSNCWYNTSDPDLFSALITLKDKTWRDSTGKYEFLVCEKLTSSGTEQQFRWSQTSNPAIDSTLTGYTKISETTSTGRSYGLYYKNSSALMHNNATWWCACGSWTAYQGGIPGFGGVVTTGYMDLYIRVPGVVMRGATTGQAAMYNSSSLANQFLEI